MRGPEWGMVLWQGALALRELAQVYVTKVSPPTARNRIQETAFLLQIVLKLRALPACYAPPSTGLGYHATHALGEVRRRGSDHRRVATPPTGYSPTRSLCAVWRLCCYQVGGVGSRIRMLALGSQVAPRYPPTHLLWYIRYSLRIYYMHCPVCPTPSTRTVRYALRVQSGARRGDGCPREPGMLLPSAYAMSSMTLHLLQSHFRLPTLSHHWSYAVQTHAVHLRVPPTRCTGYCPTRSLRAPYALCGTEIGYGPTRYRGGPPPSRPRPSPSNACTCPVSARREIKHAQPRS
eukprot:3480165-Rhodomonas_salina.1